MTDTPGDMAAKLVDLARYADRVSDTTGDDLRAAASMLRECAEREKALREALSNDDRAMRYVKMIASQKLSKQSREWYIDEFGDEGDPDFEGAYDSFIEAARTILNDIRAAKALEAK